MRGASLLFRFHDRPETPSGGSLLRSLHREFVTEDSVAIRWQLLGGPKTVAALTGYAVYAAYTAPGQDRQPRQFALYSQLPATVEGPASTAGVMSVVGGMEAGGGEMGCKGNRGVDG